MKHIIKSGENVEKVNVWCQNNPSSQDWKMNYLEFCLTTNGEFLLLKLLISQAISYYSWSFCLEHIKSKIWFGFLENNYWRHILLQAIMQIKLANLLSKLLWWNIFKWSASNYTYNYSVLWSQNSLPLLLQLLLHLRSEVSSFYCTGGGNNLHKSQHMSNSDGCCG